MDIFFEGKLTEVKKIPQTRQYWFIRTYGGEAYKDYLTNDYVGLGVNEVPLSYIKNASFEDLSSYSTLQTYLDKNTEYKKTQATRIANQLILFNREVSIGDCVFMPSRNSENLAFGTIESEMFVVKNTGQIQVKGKMMDLPEKRRKVKWEKTISKDDPTNDLKPLTASHYGITNANYYSETIESVLSSLFEKDNHTCLVIQIKQDEAINAFDLNRFLSSITYFYEEFCMEAGIEINEDLTIKIKLQSRGKMLLTALTAAGIIGLAGLIVLCNNNKLKIDLKNEQIEGSSDGLLKSYNDFLDRKEARREKIILFEDSMEKLKASRNISTNLINHVADQPQEKGK
jgi:hypothetical protein